MITRNELFSMSLDYTDINLIKKFNNFTLKFICHDEKSETTYLYTQNNHAIEMFKRENFVHSDE